MNTEPDKSNSLTDLAARIYAGHVAVQESLKLAVKCAMDTGDMLLEAKEQVGHGEWMDWLRDHCDMSQRTANLYMRLAKNRKVIEATGDVAGLTLNSAARLLASPKDETEEQDDKLEKSFAEIRVLIAERDTIVVEMVKEIRKLRSTFSTDEEYRAWLRQQDQEFPQPTDPDEILFSGIMGDMLVADVQRIFGVNMSSVDEDDERWFWVLEWEN
jgi:hypothetical protein